MIKREFGKYLRTLREKYKLTINEISKELEISKTYLSDIENGNNLPPTATKQLKLIQCFNKKILDHEYKKLLELAAIEREELPADIIMAIFDKESKKLDVNLIEKIRKIINT
jgi:transcriptional regulator with XRE-family HTH domain